MKTPDELKQQKLFQWAGDNDSLEIMKGAGFNVVPLPATELATGLQTGLVNACTTTPQVAVLTQYYNYAKNMTDMQWALLLGARSSRRTCGTGSRPTCTRRCSRRCRMRAPSCRRMSGRAVRPTSRP